MNENVHDTGYLARERNAAWEREVWFNRLGKLFRVQLRSETYPFQSYARLLMMSDGGWAPITFFNPCWDFQVELSHKQREEVEAEDGFKAIIDRFKDLAMIVADNLSPPRHRRGEQGQ